MSGADEFQPRTLAPGEVLAEADCPPGLVRGEPIDPAALTGLSAEDAATLRTSPGTGEPMTGIEHPADGTWSPAISN